MATVLITGGSGYLGQHLIHALAPQFQVRPPISPDPGRPAQSLTSSSVRSRSSTPTAGRRCITLPPACSDSRWGPARGACSPAPPGSHPVLQRQVDFVSGDGLQEAFAAAGEVDAVINCAAVSQPGLCEKDEALARWGAAWLPGHSVRGRGPGAMHSSMTAPGPVVPAGPSTCPPSCWRRCSSSGRAAARRRCSSTSPQTRWARRLRSREARGGCAPRASQPARRPCSPAAPSPHPRPNPSPGPPPGLRRQQGDVARVGPLRAGQRLRQEQAGGGAGGGTQLAAPRLPAQLHNLRPHHTRRHRPHAVHPVHRELSAAAHCLLPAAWAWAGDRQMLG